MAIPRQVGMTAMQEGLKKAGNASIRKVHNFSQGMGA
jgi:hypothetical protein